MALLPARFMDSAAHEPTGRHGMQTQRLND